MSPRRRLSGIARRALFRLIRTARYAGVPPVSYTHLDVYKRQNQDQYQ